MLGLPLLPLQAAALRRLIHPLWRPHRRQLAPAWQALKQRVLLPALGLQHCPLTSFPVMQAIYAEMEASFGLGVMKSLALPDKNLRHNQQAWQGALRESTPALHPDHAVGCFQDVAPEVMNKFRLDATYLLLVQARPVAWVQ